MNEDTWTTRDLPVLQAVVRIFDETGRPVRANKLPAECGLDEDDVQRALRALNREPYFEKVLGGDGGVIAVGAPTSAALRVAGQWPTPENQLDRLIAAIEAVAADEAQPEAERSKAKQVLLGLSGAVYQVALGTLSGAGGNMLAP